MGLTVGRKCGMMVADSQKFDGRAVFVPVPHNRIPVAVKEPRGRQPVLTFASPAGTSATWLFAFPGQKGLAK